MSFMVWPSLLLGLVRASAGGAVDSQFMQLAVKQAASAQLAANMTSARSKRAECTSAQATAGCCTPMGGGTWAFSTTGAGTWSHTASTIRFSFADDERCGGAAGSLQSGSATMSVSTTSSIDLVMSMDGMAEANYETFKLHVDGVLVANVQATNGAGGSDCKVSTCIMCPVDMPQQTLSLAPGAHEIRVDASSIDHLYHNGAFFEISFALQGMCGGCTCTTSANGDPHMVNVLGQRFDISQDGRHVLLEIPRGAVAESVLLSVTADARRSGTSCADIYFKALNVTGAWVQKEHQQLTGGLQYFANQPSGDMGTGYRRFGSVDLKVVWGHTGDGVDYLNIFARHLGKSGYPVGGLLGVDDHSAAATPSLLCKPSISLVESSLVETKQRYSSVAEASSF